MENIPPNPKLPEKKPARQSSNLVWAFLGLGVLLLLLVTVLNSDTEQEISWSQFEKLIKASNPQNKDRTGYIDIKDTTGADSKQFRISDLHDIVVGLNTITAKVNRKEQNGPNIDNAGLDRQTIGKRDPEQEEKIKIKVHRDQKPVDDNLKELLAENHLNVKFEGVPSRIFQWMPMLLLTGLMVFMLIVMIRRIGGAGSPMAFGRSRGKLYAQEDIEVTFEDVAGIDEAVDELREVVEFLEKPEKYQMLGGRIPKGVLLVGPPGTGKTLLAKAVAGEAGVPFFSLSGSDFVEMFVGVGAARVRDMFQQAEQKAPCIIFIDELDALGKTRGSGNVGGHDEREQTLNALLVEMDGFGTNSGVIVMGATNRPETLDAALLRPGRFDRHVLVDRPDVLGREEILNVHLQKIKVDAEVDVKSLAAITSGFVGADLANMVNESALLAARKEKKVVTTEDFDEAVERISVGLEKKSRIMHEDEKLRIAYHEAGHALVGYSLPNTDSVHKVSIIPRGLAALGYTLHRPEQDRFLMTQSELESRIQVLLAGTIAEEMVFEDVSSGAQNDLERATELARSMVMDFGMSRLGRVNYRESGRSPFLAGGEMPTMQTHSEETAREIDQEVKRIVDEGLQRARSILETRKAALLATAKELIKQEVIDSKELARLIEENSPSVQIVPGTGVDKKREPKPVPEDSSPAQEAPGSGSAEG